MNPKLIAYLRSLGLAETATDDQAKTFLAMLSADKRTKADEIAKDGGDNINLNITVQQPANQTAALAPKEPEKKPEPVVDVVAREEKRIASLRALAKVLSVDDATINKAIADGSDADKACEAFRASLAKTAGPIGNLSVAVGDDKQLAMLSKALPDAILIRSGVSVGKAEGAEQAALREQAVKFSNQSVLDMYRRYLVALGVPASEAMDLSRPELLELLNPRKAYRRWTQTASLSQGTSSFANILLDASNKTLRQAYQAAQPTWEAWCKRGTAPDFKNIYRTQLSDVPIPSTARNEAGEIKYTTLSDSKESWALAEYATGVVITRRAMLGDDLNAFSRVPQALVLAMRQIESNVAYGILTTNAALADTGNLFNSTAVTTAGGHANLESVTASTGAPSVTTLGAGRTRMRLQTAPNGTKLNLTPKYLLVPAALESVAEQYTSANYVAAIQTSINPFSAGGRTPLTPIVEPRLDANSATAWYLIGDPNVCDTVEVAFLQGEETPVFKSETEFDTDDMKMACRHSVAAKALDFRNMYKNAGA